jgi:NADH dehydrogenase (ubiquinone) Fe-S protein 1
MIVTVIFGFYFFINKFQYILIYTLIIVKRLHIIMTFTIYVNNLPVSVKADTTILEACQNLDIELPRFCYNERLFIAGNCRMCLVEVEKSPKPIVSCAVPVTDGMRIHTDTPLVKKARESILEFLLLNHPLDCPVCDQGGECDLQEQAIRFGSDKSRFYEFKRGVEDKNFGPLIKTIMNRCIHCTRCVRFSSEVAGIDDLGINSRGKSTEIGTYLEKIFHSELSGNVIDLCPVGALTSKPYAFTSRPWELKTICSVDTSDGIGSHIRVDLKENEILRILPRLNENINEDWISDKARFNHDGLQSQRLRHPALRLKLDSTLIPSNLKRWCVSKRNQTKFATWGSSIETIANLITAPEFHYDIVGIFGTATDLETQLSFKEFIHSLGSENIGSLNKLHVNLDFSTTYKLNSTLTRISEADLCLLIGVNPRYEGSLLNVRLRKRYLSGKLHIASIGPNFDLTYPIEHLGLGGKTLNQIAMGKHRFCSALKKAKRPIFILGLGVLERNDSYVIQSLLNVINLQSAIVISNWKGLDILHIDANQVGALDLGLGHLNSTELRFTFSKYSFSVSTKRILYLVSINHHEWSEFMKEIFFRISWNYSLEKKNKNTIYRKFRAETWVISHKNYIEFNDDSDLSLPSTITSEKVATFINTEGRPQISPRLIFSRGKIREDWSIFRALSDRLGNSLRYNTLKELQERISILLPAMNSMGKIEKNTIFKIKKTNSKSIMHHTKFSPLIEDFYSTDSISKASKIMSKCSKFLRKKSTNFS